MKYVTALKRMCQDCKVVKREQKLFVVCKGDPRHKQKQAATVYNKQNYKFK